MTTSACPPIDDADWPEAIAGMKGGFAGALNVYRTMAHHPELLKAWAPLRQHVVKDSALGPVRSELAILRAAHRMGSPYEVGAPRQPFAGARDERRAHHRDAWHAGR